jgi:glycine/D-amino acid oxidase-like deaminating enzyme
VLVLGAGLTGSCVALALAQSGHRVTVLDRAGSPMSGASGNTEARIHLGYVFALDATMVTQRHMLTGGLTFAPLLDRWLGPQPWDELRTPSCRYAVMPDSMLDADALESQYARIVEELNGVRGYVEDVARGPCSYLGQQFSGRVRRKHGDADGPLVDGQPVETVFDTEEAGIEPDRLSDAIRRGLAQSNIEVHTRTEVLEARRDDSGFAVAVTDADGSLVWWRAPAVVNCLWEDRLRVDASVDVQSPFELWTYRVKHLVIVRLARGSRAPAVTMVQGPYGDLIPWSGSRACVSWYPVGRTELRTISQRDVHEPPVRAARTPDSVVDAVLTPMTELFPSLDGAAVTDVRGGVIAAPGATDIDDPASRLHTRASAAVHEHDGWWTIDTGKYTMAPLVAYIASRSVDAALRGA